MEDMAYSKGLFEVFARLLVKLLRANRDLGAFSAALRSGDNADLLLVNETRCPHCRPPGRPAAVENCPRTRGSLGVATRRMYIHVSRAERGHRQKRFRGIATLTKVYWDRAEKSHRTPMRFCTCSETLVRSSITDNCNRTPREHLLQSSGALYLCLALATPFSHRVC